MNKIKKTILTLVALLAVTTGAWADETPLVTINSTGYTTFTSGSKTFDDKVTVTFSNSVSNDGDHWGWYADDTSSLLTVAGINGYTITSCKFYTFEGTAKTGYTVAGESPSVYLNNDYVYTDDSKSENIGKFGISKIEVYGAAASSATDPNAVTALEIDATVYSGWSSDDGVLLKASELPGFHKITLEQAKTWADVPATGTVLLIYEIVADGDIKVVIFNDGNYSDSYEWTELGRYYIWEDIKYSDNKYFYTTGPASASGPEVAWDKAKKTGTFKMPGGNVTLEPEYYPQAALTAEPTVINNVPATTDGAIVSAGTVATIGETTTAQGTVMYYVSPSALDDAALLALAADKWTAEVPTAKSLAEGQAYVYYYVKGNDSTDDALNFSDGDILATNALTVTIAAAPLWNAEFDLTNAPEEDKAGKWSTDIPEGGVVKGQTVTVTYTGTKKVIGVKAEKKAAAPASTPLDNTTTAWTAGSYAVPAGGLTYSDAITVSGDVTLTLTDGETLTLNKGISLASGATLTIEGNGTMNVNGTNNSTASTVAGSTGTLILTSGTLTAKGGNGQDMTDGFKTGASGGAAINGSVTVNGGSLTANGGNGGNCIGATIGPETNGGAGGAAISGDVTITDGAVAATGGNGGSIGASNYGEEVHGGAGGAAIGGNATLTGGTLTATQGANGTGSLSDSSVGTGGKAVAGTVTNNGGTVNQ